MRFLWIFAALLLTACSASRNNGNSCPGPNAILEAQTALFDTKSLAGTWRAKDVSDIEVVITTDPKPTITLNRCVSLTVLFQEEDSDIVCAFGGLPSAPLDGGDNWTLCVIDAAMENSTTLRLREHGLGILGTYWLIRVQEPE